MSVQECSSARVQWCMSAVVYLTAIPPNVRVYYCTNALVSDLLHGYPARGAGALMH